MPSGPIVLRQNRNVHRCRIPILDSDSEDEPLAIPENPIPSLTSANLRCHATCTRPSKNRRICQWRTIVSRKAYPFNPESIPATYPKEWLHEKLIRLRSPSPSIPFLPRSWMATTADTRAKMNITAAGSMEMLEEALRKLPKERVLDGAFEEQWKEALREAVMRKNDAVNSQGPLLPNPLQMPTEDIHRKRKHMEGGSTLEGKGNHQTDDGMNAREENS